MQIQNQKTNLKKDAEKILYMIHNIYNNYHKELDEETKDELIKSYTDVKNNNNLYLSTNGLLGLLMYEIQKTKNKQKRKDLYELYKTIIEKEGKYFKYNTIMLNFM